jgi:hypothetical protein
MTISESTILRQNLLSFSQDSPMMMVTSLKDFSGEGVYGQARRKQRIERAGILDDGV